MLSAIKQASIALGLYKPARAFYRILRPHQRRELREHRDLLAQFIKPDDLVFDVGANIGERSDLMLSMGAKVVAFEPQPALAREVRARGSKKRLTVVETAVGAESGTGELFLTASTGMASLRPDWKGVSEDRGKITVSVTTLDAEIKRYGVPTFCKIDVEGFEVDVLKGLSIPLNSLTIEYHCHEAGIARVSECLDLLKNLGEYEFNLIGTESGRLLSHHWMRHEEFVKAFPVCAQPHFYGDIFARNLAL
jgi:FkbM family methyltransferase